MKRLLGLTGSGKSTVCIHPRPYFSALTSYLLINLVRQLSRTNHEGQCKQQIDFPGFVR